MATVMKEFIDRFAQMEKLANETLAAEPGALVGVKDLPGSEHDAPVPASAKEPDKEVTQGQPAGATTAEGAVNGGDAKPLNEGKLEVDQPLENPEKKPLITDDALTAKEASSHLDKLVGELLSDIKGAQKQAAAKPAEPAKSAEPAKPADTTKQAQAGNAAADAGAAATAEPAKPAEPANGEEKKAEPKKPTLELDTETLSKIAAATATYIAGRSAAETAIKEATEKRAHALSLVKAACVKAAQEAGLDPAAAAAAADNAMAAAGIPAGEVAGADAGAAAGAEAGAAAGADAGAAGAGDVDIPQDVTEEELGSAIVDLVQSGQLDADTAKALVDEIAGDAGGAGEGVTEDQAAEIIADGLQSGEITPDQAKELINAIESGAGADAGADAGAAAAEAAGAADAATAAQEAADEAQGAADAENAIKQAAADIRKNAIMKVASAIAAKRQQVKQAEAAKAAEAAKTEQPKGLLSKVASILQKRKEEFDAKAQAAQKQAAAKPSVEDSYLAGFRKKAEEMGVDPVKLAQYVTANKERFAKAAK